MKHLRLPLRQFVLPFIALASLLLAGCEFEVPLTTISDRGLDERLLGDWVSPDSTIKIRRFDARYYVILHRGGFFRAWHSPVAGLPLVTVQALEVPEKSFAYLAYDVSPDGRRLNLRFVSDEVVSKQITDTAEIRKAIEQNVKHPQLLGELPAFTRLE